MREGPSVAGSCGPSHTHHAYVCPLDLKGSERVLLLCFPLACSCPLCAGCNLFMFALSCSCPLCAGYNLFMLALSCSCPLCAGCTLFMLAPSCSCPLCADRSLFMLSLSCSCPVRRLHKLHLHALTLPEPVLHHVRDNLPLLHKLVLTQCTLTRTNNVSGSRGWGCGSRADLGRGIWVGGPGLGSRLMV